MQQMIMNLAVNARDAMPEGGRLDVHLARTRVGSHETGPLPEMGPGDWVQIQVTDTGAGIAPEYIPHLFEPFFTTKGPGQGSGLGLPQVYGIVGQHEGHIDVTSQVGQGTTFTIYLPALPVRSPSPRSRRKPDLPTGQGEMILVVEDDPAARRALAESLVALDYRVAEAINGQRALQTLAQHPGEVALILSDVVMPGMGGVALLHAVREQALTIPVILLTGHPLEHELKDLRDRGVVEWLMKPIDLEQLAKIIARALQT
jgi:CheY-like chemotaxis protein